LESGYKGQVILSEFKENLDFQNFRYQSWPQHEYMPAAVDFPTYGTT